MYVETKTSFEELGEKMSDDSFEDSFDSESDSFDGPGEDDDYAQQHRGNVQAVLSGGHNGGGGGVIPLSNSAGRRDFLDQDEWR